MLYTFTYIKLHLSIPRDPDCPIYHHIYWGASYYKRKKICAISYPIKTGTTRETLSRQGVEERASILNGSSSLAAFRNKWWSSFMLSMATHKSFSFACRAFVTISRPIWPRFWSRSMRFPCPSRLGSYLACKYLMVPLYQIHN